MLHQLFELFQRSIKFKYILFLLFFKTFLGSLFILKVFFNTCQFILLLMETDVPLIIGLGSFCQKLSLFL